MIMKFTSIKQSLAALLCATSALWLQSASAQVETGSTTTPTKIYASTGASISFAVNYTGGETAQTDLLVVHTADISSPALAVFRGTGNCVSAATPVGFVPPSPSNALYTLWEPSGTFPANCGTSSATTPMGTFTGTVASFPASGAISIQVLLNAAGGATNSTANDVTVCQKTTVSSVSAPADAFEGSAQTFVVNFASAVPTGCGGFAIPVTLSGTATAAPDNVVITTNNCASVADGALTCTVVVQGVDDTAADGTKVVTLAVTDSTASSVYVSAGKSANGNVLDNEVSASVVASTAAASETGPTNGVFTFSRGGATTSALTLTSVVSGTATHGGGNDFTFTNGTCSTMSFLPGAPAQLQVVVPSGQASCTVSVSVIDDQVVEGAETVILAPPTGTNVTSSGSNATVTIADNDALPSVNITTAGACAEDLVPVNCTFTVTATSNTSPAQAGAGPSVPFTLTGTATNNTDYKLVLGASCAAPAFTGPIATTYGSPSVMTVCVIDDLSQEGTESVVMTLTANAAQYTLTTASATQNIADDDSPQTVTVASSGSPAEQGSATGTFTFTRAGGSTAAKQAALTVNVTLGGTATFGTSCAAGVDYQLAVVGPATASLSAAPRTITFPAGNPAVLTAAVTVTPCDDVVVDPNETVTMTVAAPTVSTDYTVGAAPGNTASLTIADNEVGVSVVGTGAIEGSNVSFSITCTGPAASTATVTFAVSGQDSGATITPAQGPVTVTCGTPTTVTVSTTNDTIPDNNRAVTLTLSNPVAPAVIVTASASAAVTDNDGVVIVPTLGTLGLGFLSLMLAGFAALQRRRMTK